MQWCILQMLSSFAIRETVVIFPQNRSTIILRWESAPKIVVFDYIWKRTFPTQNLKYAMRLLDGCPRKWEGHYIHICQPTWQFNFRYANECWAGLDRYHIYVNIFFSSLYLSAVLDSNVGASIFIISVSKGRINVLLTWADRILRSTAKFVNSR